MNYELTRPYTYVHVAPSRQKKITGYHPSDGPTDGLTDKPSQSHFIAIKIF